MPTTDEYALMVNQIRREASILPSELILNTPLGPISVENLSFLDGWMYEQTQVGYPGTPVPLLVGGPVSVIQDRTDEQGWVLAATAIFSSPYGRVDMAIDNFILNQTPYLANIMIGVPPFNKTLYPLVYNPATPLGPLYGVQLNTTQPHPYARHVRITGSLPLGSPVAACNLFTATLSRIMLQDRPTFYRSMKKFNIEQRIGKRVDRYL